MVCSVNFNAAAYPALSQGMKIQQNKSLNPFKSEGKDVFVSSQANNKKIEKISFGRITRNVIQDLVRIARGQFTRASKAFNKALEAQNTPKLLKTLTSMESALGTIKPGIPKQEYAGMASSVATKYVEAATNASPELQKALLEKAGTLYGEVNNTLRQESKQLNKLLKSVRANKASISAIIQS